MRFKYFKLNELQIMTDPSTEKIYISIQDEWVEVQDLLTHRTIQIEAIEITIDEAMANCSQQKPN